MANKVYFNNNYPDISESNKLYERAKGLIPAFTQTLAKGPGQYIDGIAPKYLLKGKGSHVWDVDGNEYIDFNMGIGPLSLGYAYEKVDNAIIEQLKKGITFSMMHPLEVEVAELLRQIIPNAESIRYSKTGCDVTSAAVRLARAYTGKKKILCCGYHGWHDWYISVTDRNKGIPYEIQNNTYTFNYNDIDSVIESIDEDTAGIILEPVVFEEPKDNFLHKIDKICKENKIVLIFDEMWTGFRLALGGAQEYFGIVPDLACYSKAIANGMPISVITGKKEIMNLLEKAVFFFTTFGGEALSLAAAKATIEEIKDKNVPQYLQKLGNYLKENLNNLFNNLNLNFISCIGYPYRTMITFNHPELNNLELKSLLQQELFKRGILWSGYHTLSFSHTKDDIEYTIKAYEDSIPVIIEAISNKDIKKYLKGKPIEPVFRKTSNFNTKPKIKK